MIVINLKAYEEVIGKKGLLLLEAAEKIYEEYNIKIILAPQPTDIFLLAQNARNVKIFAQHIDPILPGAHTGHILAKAVKEAGAHGTIINHSEKQLKISDIEKIINIGKEINLEILACANNPIVGAAISKFDPEYIAIEPPELIGTGISLAKIKPEIITKSVEIIKSTNSRPKILIGAGISDKEDVEKSIRYGAEGVLLSSSVVKAKDFYEKLKNLAEGFKLY